MAIGGLSSTIRGLFLAITINRMSRVVKLFSSDENATTHFIEIAAQPLGMLLKVQLMEVSG